MLGIIRVLTTDDQAILQEHGRRMEELHQIDSWTSCIDNQPNGIYDAASEAEAVPKIVALAQEMAKREGIDAITISCAADPGLAELKGTVDVPVLGAGICGARAACRAGSRVAVIGITEGIPPNIRKALGDQFHSYRQGYGLQKTTDLFSEEAKGKLLEAARAATGEGADVILFACTGFSTIRLKETLERQLDVPVIDLVEAQAAAYTQIRREALG